MTARVLIIDDSPVTVDLLQGALTNAGVETDSATDLKSLEQRLSNSNYELVLVDVNMPEMFGDDVVEFLRATRKLKSTLLLYSDLPEAELRQRSQSSGADGFITKSAGLESAVEQIRLALNSTLRIHRLLVASSNSGLASQIQLRLDPRRYEIHAAGSVDDATKLILKKKTRPSAALIDASLPSGPTLCRFIKSNALFSGIKVMVWGKSDAAALEEFVAAGADQTLLGDLPTSRELLELAG